MSRKRAMRKAATCRPAVTLRISLLSFDDSDSLPEVLLSGALSASIFEGVIVDSEAPINCESFLSRISGLSMLSS